MANIPCPWTQKSPSFNEDLMMTSYLWSFIIHYQPFNPTKHGGYKLLTPGAAVQTYVTNNPLLLSLPQIQWFMLLLLSDPIYVFFLQAIYFLFIQVEMERRMIRKLYLSLLFWSHICVQDDAEVPMINIPGQRFTATHGIKAKKGEAKLFLWVQ